MRAQRRPANHKALDEGPRHASQVPRRERVQRRLRVLVTAVAATALLFAGAPTIALAQVDNGISNAGIVSAGEGDGTLATDPPAATEPPATTEPPAETEPPAKTEPPATTEPPAETEPPAKTEPPATTEPPAEQKQTETPPPTESLVAPLAVDPNDPPVPNGAKFVVKKGGFRNADGTVSGLAGATFALFQAANTNTNTNDRWNTTGPAIDTCVTDANGLCGLLTAALPSGGSNTQRTFIVLEQSAPAGGDWTAVTSWGNGIPQEYKFKFVNVNRDGTPANRTYYAPNTSTNNTNQNRTWPDVYKNPDLPPQCGLDIALVMDVSGSIGNNIQTYRDAAKNFVDALAGTPSQMALFTFASQSPAANTSGTNNANVPLQSLNPANGAGRTLLDTRIQGFAIPGQNVFYTNWDAAFRNVMSTGDDYDAVLFLTDGDPTTYGNGSVTDTDFMLRNVEEAIHSANEVKADETHVMAIGIGGSVATPGGQHRLAQISGPDDYYTTDFDELGDLLRGIAEEACAGNLIVAKQFVDSNGVITEDAVENWSFTSGGETKQTNATGAVSFPIDFAGNPNAQAVSVVEEDRAGYSLRPQNGNNANCMVQSGPGTVTGYTDVGQPLGFTVNVAPNQTILCVVQNTPTAATVEVDKKWVVNGQAYDLNVMPPGVSTGLTLDPAPKNPPAQFGEVHTGYTAGGGVGVTVGESTVQKPAGCGPVTAAFSKVAGGATINSTTGVVTGLTAGANGFLITNTMTCEANLTLSKTAAGVPTGVAWSFDFTLTPGIDGADSTPFKVNGSGPSTVPFPVPGALTPGQAYTLAEADEPGWAEGTITCQPGNTIGGFTAQLGVDVTCSVTNTAAAPSLKLSKTVTGVADGYGWSFTFVVDPASGPPTQHIVAGTGPGTANLDVAGIVIGETYTVTELPKEGWTEGAVTCAPPGTNNSFTAAPGVAVTCSATNTADPADLSLTKSATGIADGTQWSFEFTLTGPGGSAQNVTNSDPTVTWNGLTPGAAYTLVETDKPGWVENPIECNITDAQPGTTGFQFTALPGMSLDCTASNSANQPGLTLSKTVTGVPDDYAWSFEFTVDPEVGGEDEFMVQGVGNTTVPVPAGALVPGTVYTVTETGQDGWTEGSVICTPGGNGNNFTAQPGVDVTCAVTNTADAPKLTLSKTVEGVPDDYPWAFHFTVSPEIDGESDFVVDGSGPGTVNLPVVGAVIGETYTVTEVDQPGWTEGPVTCVPGSANTFEAAPGSDVTCSATNTVDPASVKLTKSATGIADGTPWSFEFTLTGPGGSAKNVTDAAPSATWSNLTLGEVYTLTETDADGWTEGPIVCTGPEDGNGILPGFQFTATPGLALDCTATNAADQPDLTLKKTASGVAVGVDWTFVFTVDPSIGGASQFEVSGTGPATNEAEVVGLVPGTEYTVTENPQEGWTEGEVSCEPGDGNTFTAAPGVDVVCSVTNRATPPVITHDKTVVSSTAQPDGTWDVVYSVVVTNPSAIAAGDYDLSDALQIPASVTPSDQSAQWRVLPAGALNPIAGWTGDAPNTTLATDRAIDPSAQHEYLLAVTYTIADGTSFAPGGPLDCDTTSANRAFLNKATLNSETDRYACAEPAKPTFSKVADGATPVVGNDGQWDVSYQLTVSNPSSSQLYYDLNDTPVMPPNVTLVSGPTITAWSTPPGETALPIENMAIAPNSAHEFTVTVRVEVSPAATSGDLTCDGEPGSGIVNGAVVTSSGQTIPDEDCVSIPLPNIKHTKTVSSVSQNPDGTWNIEYTITVNDPGTVPGLYTLRDATAFGPGITYDPADASVTGPGDVNANWNGTTDTLIVENNPMEPPLTHYFTVTIENISVAEGVIGTSPAGTCPAPGSDDDRAFNNVAGLLAGGVTTNATACEFPTIPTPTKSGATSQQQPDSTWNVSYTITVDNSDGKAGYYALTDAPLWDDATVTITSWTVTSDQLDPDISGPFTDGVIVPTSAQMPIAAGATHTYAVVFNVSLPGVVPPSVKECATDFAPGKGFVNEVQLFSGNDTRDDRDCVPMTDAGVPTVVKGDPETTQGADGVWTMKYTVTVTGNPTYVTKYSLSDDLQFGGAIDIQTAAWKRTAPQGESGSWTDGQFGTPQTLATDRTIDAGAVETYVVTVTALVDPAAFDDPSTNTCQPSDQTPNVGFLNAATLTSSGMPQTDTGCATPAEPDFTKIANQALTKVGDNWKVTYTLTAENTHPTQSLVYDLTDTPAFSSGVTVVSRTVTSADAPVNPAWNTLPPTTPVVASDVVLPGGDTDVFTVEVVFSVNVTEDTSTFNCSTEGGGDGLFNTATLISGGDYPGDDCVDIPVKVIVDKYWVINGGEPIPEGQQPEGLVAELELTPLPDGSAPEWGEAEDGYEAGGHVDIGESLQVTIDGCEFARSAGLGEHALPASVNEFDVTNYVDCAQTLNLEKVVHNNHGGNGEAVDWTLTATAEGADDPTVSGEGTATGDVDLDVTYTLDETSTVWNSDQYKVAATWSCTSPQGEDAFTLNAPGGKTAELTIDELGATVDCEIVNEDIAPTLTLEKFVEPENVLADPEDWNLFATDPEAERVVEGLGGATGEIEAGVVYTLGEEAAPDFPYAELFSTIGWYCSVDDGPSEASSFVNAGPGDDVYCSITNTAIPVDPLVTKTLTSIEQATDGTWDLEYRVTVQNPSEVLPIEYDLDDTLYFGEGIVVNDAAASGPGNDDDAWNGETETDLAIDQVVVPESTDVYTIAVNATVTATAWSEDGVSCDENWFTDGGFRNTATLSWGSDGDVTVLADGSGSTSASVCAEPGRADVVKTSLGTATKNSDGTYTVSYEIVVSNPSEHDLYYDLRDDPWFAPGTSIVNQSATFNGTPIGGWTSAQPLAEDRVIDAADGSPTQHVYVVTFRVDVRNATNGVLAKCAHPGTGLYNTAVLVNGTLDSTSSACEPFTPIVKPTPPAPSSIASTGFGNGSLIWIVAGLLGIGALLLLLARRRRAR